MAWSKSFSPPVRILLTTFGVANIVGTLLTLGTQRGTQVLLPGLVIGLAFATLGLKGGYPIIPSGTPDSIQAGLRTIRQRRNLMWIGAILLLILGSPILISIPNSARTTVFFLISMVVVIPFLTWAMSACPRCGKHFYIHSGLGRIRPRCVHCGLGITDG
jgi:hypothetical protein